MNLNECSSSYFTYIIKVNVKPRTCKCQDLNKISGELIGSKDPTNLKGEWDPSPPNQQARYFIQIFICLVDRKPEKNHKHFWDCDDPKM